MKVKDLVSKVRLIAGQNIQLVDHNTATIFLTKDRYCFDFDSDEVERLMKLRVTGFSANEDGITIHAV